MYLSGGPGGAGIIEMIDVLLTVPSLLDRFNVIGFDQRGTGASGLLRCPAIERDGRLRSTSAGERCATGWAAAGLLHDAGLRRDMEAIRKASGSGKLTLFGISYGTTLALAYARAYPQRVERLILDSVADPDEADPYGLAGFRAMPPRCGRSAGRTAVSGDPAADLSALVARVRRTPLRGEVFTAGGQAAAPGGPAGRDRRPDVRRRLPARAAGGGPRGRPRRLCGRRRSAAALLRISAGFAGRRFPRTSRPPVTRRCARRRRCHGRAGRRGRTAGVAREGAASARAGGVLPVRRRGRSRTRSSCACGGRTRAGRSSPRPGPTPTCPRCCSRARRTCGRRPRPRRGSPRCSRAHARDGAGRRARGGRGGPEQLRHPAAAPLARRAAGADALPAGRGRTSRG